LTYTYETIEEQPVQPVKENVTTVNETQPQPIVTPEQNISETITQPQNVSAPKPEKLETRIFVILIIIIAAIVGAALYMLKKGGLAKK